MNQYKKISSKYKLKFFNLILNDFLQKLGGYDLSHDQKIYKIANFGAKVRPDFINFTFGLTNEKDFDVLLFLLHQYNCFVIIPLNSTLINISFDFSDENVKKLKQRKSNSELQKRMKQLIINCYRKIKDIKIEK